MHLGFVNLVESVVFPTFIGCRPEILRVAVFRCEFTFLYSVLAHEINAGPEPKEWM